VLSDKSNRDFSSKFLFASFFNLPEGDGQVVPIAESGTGQADPHVAEPIQTFPVPIALPSL
jgi:hypothetical protein